MSIEDPNYVNLEIPCISILPSLPALFVHFLCPLTLLVERKRSFDSKKEQDLMTDLAQRFGIPPELVSGKNETTYILAHFILS